eukprot:125027-Pyramimonas_sp.AAC.1
MRACARVRNISSRLTNDRTTPGADESTPRGATHLFQSRAPGDRGWRRRGRMTASKRLLFV